MELYEAYKDIVFIDTHLLIVSEGPHSYRGERTSGEGDEKPSYFEGVNLKNVSPNSPFLLATLPPIPPDTSNRDLIRLKLNLDAMYAIHFQMIRSELLNTAVNLETVRFQSNGKPIDAKDVKLKQNGETRGRIEGFIKLVTDTDIPKEGKTFKAINAYGQSKTVPLQINARYTAASTLGLLFPLMNGSEVTNMHLSSLIEIIGDEKNFPVNKHETYDTRENCAKLRCSLALTLSLFFDRMLREETDKSHIDPEQIKLLNKELIKSLQQTVESMEPMLLKHRNSYYSDFKLAVTALHIAELPYKTFTSEEEAKITLKSKDILDGHHFEANILEASVNYSPPGRPKKLKKEVSSKP